MTVRYHLGPLDAGETAAYINHRLARAAAAAPLEFPRAVTDLVHARSGGMPRMINVICDAALLVGYAENVRAIDVPLMQMAISELEASTVLRRKDGTTPAATAAQGAPAIEHRRTCGPRSTPGCLSAHRAGGSGRNRRCGRRAGCAARHASAAAVGGT